jgi:hypothetical protein
VLLAKVVEEHASVPVLAKPLPICFNIGRVQRRA